MTRTTLASLLFAGLVACSGGKDDTATTDTDTDTDQFFGSPFVSVSEVTGTGTDFTLSLRTY